MKKISIIVPIYNAERHLEECINSIVGQSYKNIEIILINDGSTDNTKNILIQNKLNAIHLVQNLGIGGAVQTGYKYALDNNYDVAVQFDGDGQHDIRSLNSLIQPILLGKADMVIGSRFVGETLSEFQTSFMRRFGIGVISNMIKLTTGIRIWDTTSGYRLGNKKVIAQFARRYPTKYPEPESSVHLIKQNFKIVEASANMFERAGGVSSITPFKSIRYMVEVCSSILIASLMKEGE